MGKRVKDEWRTEQSKSDGPLPEVMLFVIPGRVVREHRFLDHRLLSLLPLPVKLGMCQVTKRKKNNLNVIVYFT